MPAPNMRSNGLRTFLSRSRPVVHADLEVGCVEHCGELTLRLSNALHDCCTRCYVSSAMRCLSSLGTTRVWLAAWMKKSAARWDLTIDDLVKSDCNTSQQHTATNHVCKLQICRDVVLVAATKETVQ